jgi:hypothetical protein
VLLQGGTAWRRQNTPCSDAASEVDDFADACGAVVLKEMIIIIALVRTGCCFQQNGAPPPQSSVRGPAYRE